MVFLFNRFYFCITLGSLFAVTILDSWCMCMTMSDGAGATACRPPPWPSALRFAGDAQVPHRAAGSTSDPPVKWGMPERTPMMRFSCSPTRWTAWKVSADGATMWQQFKVPSPPCLPLPLPF
ncbi:hypothetical protein ZWY2020_042466 [Hordeum vulgare]|nr:hypothetical protein ZWY2020_042466 [Hordeum vulgare]